MVEDLMDDKEKKKYDLEKRISMISARLSNIYNITLKNSLKSEGTNIHKGYLSIDKECSELLVEFNNLSLNPLLINWRDEYKFFQNN